MNVIEIKIGKSKYRLSINESEKEKLIKLAEKIDRKIENLASDLPNVDEKLLFVINALKLEEALEISKKKEKKSSKKSEENEEFDEELEDDELDENKKTKSCCEAAVQSALSDNMENMASCIEDLAKRIGSSKN